MEPTKREGFRRLDEGAWQDPEGNVYEERGGKMVPTGGKVAGPGEGTALARPEDFAPASELLVRPEVGIEEAKKVWDAFTKFRQFILEDPACYDDIGGTKEMNRTGATRLAVPFGLSIKHLYTETEALDTGSVAPFPVRDRVWTVGVSVFKGKRSVDGEGSASLSEIAETEFNKKLGKEVPIPLGKRIHFAKSRAWTRGVKRAISDILGGTEVD